MSNPGPAQFDYVLVGGGLGNCLVALAIFEAQPTARVALIEQRGTLGGNHLWCFHEGDLSAGQRFVESLVSKRWPAYEVRFPSLNRRVEQRYAAVRSEQLDRVVQTEFRRRPSSRLMLGTRVRESKAQSVLLSDGTAIDGRVVIESRGPESFEAGTCAGYQKFLGLELKLKRPCTIETPLLMDALVSQREGFRFMYALPFDSETLLLEDTYFSDSSDLDVAGLEQKILDYAQQNGIQIDRIVRRETGVLPLPTRLPALALPTEDAPLVGGYQGGWFHPVTGYSFPVAARVAAAVAGSKAEQLRTKVWPQLVAAQRRQMRFCILLNRMFFDAFAPEDRYSTIERFYRLPPELVRRFYALNMTHADRARVVCGRPPRGFSFSRILSGGANASPALGSTTGGALL